MLVRGMDEYIEMSTSIRARLRRQIYISVEYVSRYGLLLILLLVACGVAGLDAAAQRTTYDQRALGDLLNRQGEGPLPPEPIPYAVYTIEHSSGNSVRARHDLYNKIGAGEPERGRERLALTLLLNGATLTDLRLGDTLALPARPEHFDLDPRAYSPFPLEYPGAAYIEKVVVVDKDVQSWAAYEYGQLKRWGPASTGAEGTPTPTGRFYMNWRELERVSTESPPDQVWRMRYVMNIHNTRGIHLHQYDSVPSGPPVGHGCVRMILPDAKWLWEWSHPWITTAGRGAIGGEVKKRGTMVIVQGEEPKQTPRRVTIEPHGARRIIVSLPPDPELVELGV